MKVQQQHVTAQQTCVQHLFVLHFLLYKVKSLYKVKYKNMNLKKGFNDEEILEFH